MKKILLIIACLLCFLNVALAERVVGRYSLSYFDKTYEIEASKIERGKFSVFIQVSAKDADTRAMLDITNDKVDELKQALSEMKEKFMEWSNIAKDNNVTEMEKTMDIRFPSMSVCWHGSKWFFSFGHKFQPKFMILESGKHIVLITRKVTSSSNKYIDETIYWVFSNPEEIDELISQLDIERIESELTKTKNESELFK
jgi:hypothetical protein